jgi:hypothetical protein
MKRKLVSYIQQQKWIHKILKSSLVEFDDLNVPQKYIKPSNTELFPNFKSYYMKPNKRKTPHLNIVICSGTMDSID